MKKGKFWFYVFDADVAKHEGDWLGMATLPYDADAGVHVLTLNKGKADAKNGRFNALVVRSLET